MVTGKDFKVTMSYPPQVSYGIDLFLGQFVQRVLLTSSQHNWLNIRKFYL